MSEPPLHVRAPADSRFWFAVATQVRLMASATGGAERDLEAVQVVLPNWAGAASVRAALGAFWRASFVPPRFLAWPELGAGGSGRVTRRAQLFEVLRSNAWVRANFGNHAEALWSLAQQVETIADELTYAAVSGPEAMSARIEVALARHYRHRAGRALMPQARLILDLWRAGGDASATQRLAALRRLADTASAPLVFVAGLQREPWVDDWLAAWSHRAPVAVIVPDAPAVIRASPLLAAAWPELAGADSGVPIAARADAVRATSVPAPLSIVCAASLEEEASAVAQQTLDWLRQSVASIALVPLDRLTARRVRALLERAQVQVRDETGWRLSTTSAAGAVMRWYDLVADDLYWRDVLDWLKSSFTLATRPNKAREIALLERAIRSAGALQGARAIRRALDEAHANDVETADARDDRSGAREVLALIELQAQATARGGATLGAQARALGATLDALGMRAALAADPVGAAVLREIDALDAELAGLPARATLAEFRALLAARLEDQSFIDRQVDSNVVMVSLAATVLRQFEAVILIGADADHLPTAPAELLFMSNAVRAELGLATAESELHAQAQHLALLFANTPRVSATWRARAGTEPNTLSPLLERLQLVASRALGDDLVQKSVRATHEVEAIAATRPAPSAATLLPGRVTASQAQSLVNCAYQFYARRLLGLSALDDLIEMPDKRDFGEALHEVLRRFHREWGDTAFHEGDADRFAASLREHAHAVFDRQIVRTPGLLAFARRFDGLIDGYIDWLRGHSSKGWRWTAGEEKVTQAMRLRDGRAVELVGRVDRIDTGAGGRIQVLDYKARAAAGLKAGLKHDGEDIQLPFYGLLLAQRPVAAAYVSFDRASEEDGGVEQIEPPQAYAPLVEAVGARLRSDLQRIADGAPLPAIGVDSVCKFCEMRGLCRRDFWRDDGEDAP